MKLNWNKLSTTFLLPLKALPQINLWFGQNQEKAGERLIFIEQAEMKGKKNFASSTPKKKTNNKFETG